METEEEQRLQRAAATEDLVVVPAAELDDESWDRRAEHHAGAAGGDDDDDPEIRRDPMVKGWRWLKAVSMVVFTARPNKTTTNTMRLRSPQRRTHEVDVSKLNTGPWLNSPQRRTAAQVQPSLPPQQPAEFGSKNSVPEVVMDIASPRTAQVGVVHGNPDDDKEQRGRCLKYSQKALGFAVCTFIGYAANASTNTAFKMAIAPFFLAICADLLSLKTKAKLGSALVYFSSLHLLLMTYLIFIAFDMDHAYAILFLPLVVFASHLQQKLWPPKPPPPDAQEAQQSADERNKAASKELDSIFEMSALILNWSSFVSAIMTVVRHFITAAGKDNDEIAPGAVGLLFFLTIILGIYLMLASTVRSPALNLPTRYLDVVLICLLLGTLIATVMTFSGANWKEKQSPPAGGSS
ncbi:unnamed protein product [Miscanthus lutarioriparius]|uniref:Uncharacterized protein n=1 Tax=Miscanthus lutarioriparius TaxID=422564 RepID=A0A811R7G6_9POAL|nr:unnamed protein product [Miscanthus lutarioriparius]